MKEGKEVKENWLPVKGYEGLYEVSDWGHVRSLNYGRTGKTRLLRPAKNTFGYLQVGLRKDGEIKMKTVHRLVAEAFVPNPNPAKFKEVNHKSCKVLNFACCLEWCDRKYNINYGVGKTVDSHSKPVDQLDKAGNLIRSWKSVCEASRQLGVHKQSISFCARGILKTAGGYIWKFAS